MGGVGDRFLLKYVCRNSVQLTMSIQFVENEINQNGTIIQGRIIQKNPTFYAPYKKESTLFQSKKFHFENTHFK